MKKKLIATLLATAMCATALTACGSTDANTDAEENTAISEDSSTGAADEDVLEETEITLFAAASLSNVMLDVIAAYNETQPNITIIPSYDSSGTLLAQIEEGAACDIFFSAAQKQMNTLENEDGLMVAGTRNNVVNNQVCIITLKDSGTAVTGLDNIADASSFALAAGSVPVGKYTRQALVNNGQLEAVEDVSLIETADVSTQLGGVVISEQDNVSKVLMAVAEGSCEVGTVYYSDYVGYVNKDELEIIETISYDLTGNVIYPIAQVVNAEADELQTAAAADFEAFVLSDTAKAIFEEYGFDTDVAGK